MQLFELSKGTRFKFTEPMPVPVDAHLIGNGVLTFHHVDGMYSYCTDDDGHVYHPAAWSKVEMINE